MAVPLEKFVQQLEDSGILASDTIKDFIPPKASPNDAVELARELVRKKKLTKFQAEEISKGKGKSLVLGNYVLMEQIGAGGMGQVFKAEHRRMKRIVAIKLLPAAMTQDKAAIARFEREVEAAAKISHPNIVAAHDADCANGVHFLVMELVEGNDLSALVKKKGPLPVAEALNYILQAAKGLEAAHKKGIVHRDIKPANLLLDIEGTVKILDMGLARLSLDGDDAPQADLTSTGTIMGTVDYMAPEQALDTKAADARADIYALGCSLFFLLTGKSTYEGDTLMKKLLAHREQPIPSLRVVRLEVPEQLETVFKKMVAKKVEDRYQSMSEVMVELECCMVGPSSSVTSQQPATTAFQDEDTFDFLKELPQEPTILTKALKTSASGKSGYRNDKRLPRIGAAVLCIAILAGIIVSLRTNDGTLIVEVDQPDANIQVLNEQGKVEISQKGGKGLVSISVDPGKHRLKVEKEGFTVFGRDFEMSSGGKTPIKAKLVPLEEKAAMVRIEPTSVVPPKLPTTFEPKKQLAFETPGFDKWAKEVANMPAEKQVAAVQAKLVELNPGFDGDVKHGIERNAVISFRFLTDNVTDISPLRALRSLSQLICNGSEAGDRQLSDLSPLRGLRLTTFTCNYTSVDDLSPLETMPLRELHFANTHVSDLSPLHGMQLTSLLCLRTRVSTLAPLKGMPLTHLETEFTPISDLSYLAGMPLTLLHIHKTNTADLSSLKDLRLKRLYCDFVPERDTEIIQSIKTLEHINNQPAAEFWVDVNEKRATLEKWLKGVAGMPANQQLEAVAAKLVELNPGFNGKVTPTIDGDQVTGIKFITQNVADISPLRALTGLRSVDLSSNSSRGLLVDLWPLKGMSLTSLNCAITGVSDLSPLRGMPLVEVNCSLTQVSDLSPLAEMSLTILSCFHTPISDLSPLQGMPIGSLNIGRTLITNISPLNGTPLVDLVFDFNPKRDIEVLRSLTKLSNVNGQPATDFWKDVAEASDTLETLNDVNFQRWLKDTSTLPAEAQIAAVSKKLQDLNPSFDGTIEHRIEMDVVTELKFASDKVWNISPVKALAGLKSFDCSSSDPNKNLGRVSDLSPLAGMRLTTFACNGTLVSDLTPLRGMPLNRLDCVSNQVSDLTPIQGMPLVRLNCSLLPISDLSPLRAYPRTSAALRVM